MLEGVGVLGEVDAEPSDHRPRLSRLEEGWGVHWIPLQDAASTLWLQGRQPGSDLSRSPDPYTCLIATSDIRHIIPQQLVSKLSTSYSQHPDSDLSNVPDSSTNHYLDFLASPTAT